jgi:hypothetical protein
LPDFPKPFSKPSIPSSPVKKPPTIQSCPPAVPLGDLHHVLVFIDCTGSDGDCSNSVGVDKLGTQYFIKPGCQCTWAD